MCINPRTLYACSHVHLDNWQPCPNASVNSDGRIVYCEARSVFTAWVEMERCFGCRYAGVRREVRGGGKGKAVRGEGEKVEGAKVEGGKVEGRRKRANAMSGGRGG